MSTHSRLWSSLPPPSDYSPISMEYVARNVFLTSMKGYHCQLPKLNTINLEQVTCHVLLLSILPI